RLFKLLAQVPAVASAKEPTGNVQAPTVTFEAVGFAYPGGRDAAHTDLDFTIKAGERVGIVGPSGAGKSTIVRLLLRLYDPQKGRVLLGGQDLRCLPLAQPRNQLAVVNQDTYLFHGSVEENLRFGKEDATQGELEAAARAANAHAFISALPDGYQTVIGERGTRLSGGQRQRIAIARALLRDAPILVLDEALSSLDAENEAVIQEALNRLMAGRTTLILAHRLSSVIDADRILVLDQGRVVESGTHGALMAAGGVYHELMAAQAQDRRQALMSDLAPWAVPVEDDSMGAADVAMEAGDAILRAEGMGWIGATKSLLAMIAPWRVRLGITFGLGITRVSALISVGVLSALTVAALRSGGPTGPLLTALILVAPLAGILHWLEAWAAHDMAYRLLAEMRISLFKKLDQLAPAYLLRRRSGDLVAMATQDVEMVEYFFAHTVTPAFVAVLVPLSVMATLISFGWPTALALAPFLVLVGLSPFLLRRRLDTLASRARMALGDLNAHAVDTVQGVGEIIAFGQAQARGADYLRRIDKYHLARLPFHRDLAMQTALVELATGLGGLAVVVTGTALASRGGLDSGILPMLSLLAMAAFLPISEIAHVGRQLADTLGATRRLDAVNREQPSVVDGPGVENAPALGKGFSFAFEDVSFAYPGANRGALHEVRFDAAAGSTVALVGPSGAGKTTVAHMLMRFWDPDSGVVRLNGVDLRQYGLEALRGQIALVTQDTYLFNTTLAENIRIARPEATNPEVMVAVEQAALRSFVNSLPDGLETAVGERGVHLSGGQRQRVAIARAFLKDAPVLILDEATSHLDAASERAVHSALGALMQARTTVVIAHRLSTIRNADKIVVLDQGRVVEAGTHEVLLAQSGLYAHLIGRQLTIAAAAD
ncbi:MAG: thiol reductant ABC exporter subunit CydC, partial [Alphaproteobacteria bacterium]